MSRKWPNRSGKLEDCFFSVFFSITFLPNQCLGRRKQSFTALHTDQTHPTHARRLLLDHLSDSTARMGLPQMPFTRTAIPGYFQSLPPSDIRLCPENLCQIIRPIYSSGGEINRDENDCGRNRTPCPAPPHRRHGA